MRHHHRIDVGVGAGGPNCVEANAASWSLFCFDDTAPFGRVGHHIINMPRGRNDRQLLERLPVNVDLGVSRSRVSLALLIS